MILTDRIDRLLDRAAAKSRTLQFGMNLPALGIEHTYSSTNSNQHFHSASVGKLMTSTLIFMAIEQGRLTLNSKVHGYLREGLMDKLFVFEGRDHQRDVTVRQLLEHTSGVNDYFEGSSIDGSRFIDAVIQQPDTFWKPEALLDYSRHNQRAVGSPGQRFLYSDTGYILLGLLLEEILGMPFGQALEEFIFTPAGMSDSTLCFNRKGWDQHALAPLYVNTVDVHLFTSLSCDFSGGGLSVTASDLLKFLESLWSLRLVSKGSLEQMSSFDHRFRQGLHYGVGLMQIRFKEFFFLLRSLPKLQGHLGITGVHAWFDPDTGDSFVLNVGDTAGMVMSFRLLIMIVQIVQREHRKHRVGRLA